MGQQSINDGESGLNVRTALNQMFTDLYGALVFPTRLPGIASNTTYVVPADTFIQSIDMMASSGTPTVSIGTSPNGTDIVASQQPGTFSTNLVEKFFAAATTLWITVSGGAVNFRINQMTSYF